MKACEFSSLAASADVSSLDLITKMDRGIKRRLRLIDTPDADKARKWSKRIKPIKMLLIIIYCLLPFIETPAWCIANPEIVDPWYCENKNDTI